MIYIDREYLFKRSLFILLLIVIGWIFLFYSPPDIDKKLIEKNDSYFYGVCEEYSSFNPQKIVIHSVTDIDGDLICDKAIVYRDTKSDIDCVEPRIGNILKINGSSEVFCEPGNPGQFNELSYYTSLGFQAKIFASKISVVDDNKDVVADLMNEIRTGLVFILYKYLPEDVAGTVAAITVGEKSGLEERTKELYRQSGIAHILAISGLHISLVGYGLFMFLRRFLFHKKVAAFLSGGLVFFYGLMTGFSLSARRAVVMMIVLLISNIIEKKYDSLNSLALAALIELCLHPLSLYQSAFWFSYGTVFGIIVFVKAFERLEPEEDRPILRALFRMSAGSVGVFVVTLPIVVQSYHEVPVYGVFANVLLLPMLSFLLGGGLLAAVVAAVPGGGEFLFGGVFFGAKLYQVVTETIAMLPGHALITGHKGLISILVYYMMLILILLISIFDLDIITLAQDALALSFARSGMGLENTKSSYRRLKHPSLESDYDPNLQTKNNMLYHKMFMKNIMSNFLPCFKSRRLCIIIILVVNLIIFLVPKKTSGITITNLDVGQGDCAVVQFEDGTNIMIDGGSSDVNEVGEYRIVPFLKYMGIDRLDYVFVTHSDADHVSGIKEMLETDLLTIDMPVIVLPEIDNKDENYVELEELIIASGREIKYMKKGDSILLGDLEHNASDDNISYDNDKQTKIRCLHPYPEYNYTDVNDYSLVLEISYGNFRGIFTGDLGADAEAELTDLNDVDYLKVGHHGSKNSSSEAFLSTIKPEVSVASAGKDNRYHHPATEAVNRIKSSGSDFFCTIVSGAVTTHTDGTKIAVSEYRSVS